MRYSAFSGSRRYDSSVRRLQVLYLALGSSTAILNPFLIVILAAHGLSPGVIGIFAALGAAGLFAAGPIWGHIGDYVIGRRSALLAATIIASAMAVAISAPVPALALGAFVAVYTMSQGSSLGLCDSLAVGVMTDPHRDYGRIRVMASIAFGIVSIVAGFVYNFTGYGLGSWLFVLSGIVIAAVLVFVPDHRPPRGAHPAREVGVPGDGPAIRRAPRFGSTGLAFRLEPRLPGVLASAFLVWLAVNVSFTFLSLRIVDLGGDASDVALAFGVSALAEVPGMLLAARVAARIGLRGLFGLGALGFTVSFLAWMVLDAPSQIVAVRVLTGVSYGALSVAMVLTMGELLPGALQATGQTLYQATALGLGAIASSAVGGLLYDSAGAPALFGVCAVSATAGAALGWLALPTRVLRLRVPPDLEEVVLPNLPVL